MLHEYIEMAIDAYEHRIQPNSTFRKHDDLFDILVDLIADKSDLDPDALRITEENFKGYIGNIIKDIAGEADPVAEFYDKIGDLEDEVEENYREYTILFPLNFNYTNAEGFKSPLMFLDLTFERIPYSFWDDAVETAEDKGTFERFLEDVPTERNRSSPFSHQRYWRVKYEAASKDYAVNKVTRTLGVLLGEIAFAAHFKHNPHTYRNSIWPRGVTDLQHPLCYLIFQGDEYIHHYNSYDLTPRWHFSLTGGKKRAFNEVFPQLPDFTNGNLDDIGEHLVTAFSAYFSALSEPEPNQSFLHYWRCLEAATLTRDEGYFASDPLKRARATIRPESIEISDGRIEKLVQKRNSLVHKDGRVSVSEGDLVHLKTLSESTIWFLVTEKENYNLKEFDRFLEFGSKPEESILQAKRDREDDIIKFEEDAALRRKEIEAIEQVMEWLNIEE